MFAVWKNVIGNDALSVALRKVHSRDRSWRLFVEHRAQFGFSNDLLKDGELGAVEVFSLLVRAQMRQVQGPDTNFRDLERVENIHGHGIRPLIGQMASNPAAQPFKRLTDVNRFAIVVVEGIDAPLASTDSMSLIVAAVEERFDLAANGRDVGRETGGLNLTRA